VNAFLVDLENKPGAIATLAEALGAKGVNITGVTGASCGDSGRAAITTADDTAARQVFQTLKLPFKEYEATEVSLAHTPGSLGKAIPGAEILVLREDGTACAPDEPGELVHRGALVAMGYWNDPEKTAERYKPLPDRETGLRLGGVDAETITALGLQEGGMALTGLGDNVKDSQCTIADFPDAIQQTAESLRSIVRRTIPGVVEGVGEGVVAG